MPKKRINQEAKDALDIIVHSYAELYLDADQTYPNGYKMVFPDTGFKKEALISIMPEGVNDHMSFESLNYLIHWDWYKAKAMVHAPDPEEAKSHPLRSLVETVHEKLKEAGFTHEGPMFSGDPSWMGFNGRNLCYTKN